MTSFSLKILAIVLMLIDHIGAVLFPNILFFRLIGRLAFPLFAFQIGVGYSHTKNKPKHILTLLTLAIISQLPFYLMLTTHSTYVPLNILFTFSFALSIIYTKEKIEPLYLKIPLIAIVLLGAYYVKVDYDIYGILLTILLYYFSNNKIMSLFSLIALTFLHIKIFPSAIYQIYAIFSFIFIWLFNGQKGPNFKWLFYVFYPLHMIILFVIEKFIFYPVI